MREIKWHVYLIAFVITTLLFMLGILIGVQVNQQATGGVQQQLGDLQKQAREMEVFLILQSAFPNQSNEYCGLYGDQMQRFNVQTTGLGKRLDLLEKRSGRNDQQAQELKKDYSNMELRDYLLIRTLNEKCGNRVHTVLYFYTNRNCPVCTQQGAVLDSLKNENPEVMIYSFDTDLNTSAILATQKIFGISEMPSLIINNNPYSGFRGKEEIRSLLAGN